MKLILKFQDHKYDIEMQSSTTSLFAAKRCADIIGLDDELYWVLLLDGQALPDDTNIAHLDNQEVTLGLVQ